MSCSLWRWTKKCDGQPCVGDCDMCSFDSSLCSDCKYLVEDKSICGHPLLDEDLNDECEWYETK